jgi:hypothetical protein
VGVAHCLYGPGATNIAIVMGSGFLIGNTVSTFVGKKITAYFRRTSNHEYTLFGMSTESLQRKQHRRRRRVRFLLAYRPRGQGDASIHSTEVRQDRMNTVPCSAHCKQGFELVLYAAHMFILDSNSV